MGATPFGIRDGWPDPLPEAEVTATEAGIGLGSLFLSDRDWAVLQDLSVMTLRIDDHPTTDGYTTRHPDGSEETTEFDIPTHPVNVPRAALANSRTFSDWVWKTHGALGLLLVWDQSERWWVVHDPDLEVQIICAPRGTFEEDQASDPPFSWLPGLTDSGRAKVARLAARYGITAGA